MTPTGRPLHKAIGALLLAAIAVAGSPADELSGVELVYRLDSAPGTRQTPNQAMEVIRTRLKELKLESGIKLSIRGENSLVVRLEKKDKTHLDRVKRVVAEHGKLEFRITVEKDQPTFDRAWTLFQTAREKKGVSLDAASRINPNELSRADKKRFPHGLRWCRIGPSALAAMRPRCARDKEGAHWMLVELDDHNLSNEDLVDISVYRQASVQANFAIGFAVARSAQDRMSALTDLSNRDEAFMAILLDGRPIMAPRLNSPLRTNGVISAGFTEVEAKHLAAVLRSSPLELTPVLVSEKRGK